MNGLMSRFIDKNVFNKTSWWTKLWCVHYWIDLECNEYFEHLSHWCRRYYGCSKCGMKKAFSQMPLSTIKPD